MGYKTPSRCPTCGHEEKKPTRSIQQNRYMWGVVYKMIAQESGYSIDEVHELMKRIIFPRLGIDEMECVIGDQVINIPEVFSTTQLDVRQMNDYLSECREFAKTQLNCIIPEPNEDWGQ